MIPVDEAMLQAGYEYSRYMDDERIAGALKTEVLAMRRSGTECRRRGLIASPSKTKLLFGDAAEKVDRDDARSRAVYLMDPRQRSEAKKALRATLEDRLHEDGHIDVCSTTFSLWRLAQLRDEGVGKMALDRLDDLSASGLV
jgi:hypothetical protein